MMQGTSRCCLTTWKDGVGSKVGGGSGEGTHVCLRLIHVDVWPCMCVCMLSRFSHVHLFATRWTVARQAPLSLGFSRQEYWSGVPCSPPGDLPNPGIKSASPTSLALAGGFSTLLPPRKCKVWQRPSQYCNYPPIHIN